MAACRHERPPRPSLPPAACRPTAPCGALISGLPTNPRGSLNSETFLDSLERGISHYLVSILAANTKYSVNRQFIPVRHFSLSTPHAHAKPKATERPGSRDEPLKTRKIWKLSTGPDFFRPRSKQERMTHKRRLVSSRQGFVCVTFVTPTCCVSAMWITGRISAWPALRGLRIAGKILIADRSCPLTKSSCATSLPTCNSGFLSPCFRQGD